jgi:hypothetical protein
MLEEIMELHCISRKIMKFIVRRHYHRAGTERERECGDDNGVLLPQVGIASRGGSWELGGNSDGQYLKKEDQLDVRHTEGSTYLVEQRRPKGTTLEVGDDKYLCLLKNHRHSVPVLNSGNWQKISSFNDIITKQSCSVLKETVKSYIFWDTAPCSPLKVDFQRSAWRHIPGDRPLHKYRLRKQCFWMRYFFSLFAFKQLKQNNFPIYISLVI